jgi:hypothetical protein
MINYKFRSCYKKMDIYKPVGCSMADRGPVGSSLTDRHVLLNATWPTCMLLCRHATVQGPMVHHTYKFTGQKCIFKVQGPTVHHVTSLGGQKCIFKVHGLCDTHLQVHGPVVHLTQTQMQISEATCTDFFFFFCSRNCVHYDSVN